MSDLISRQAAIDAHCELCEDKGFCGDICPDVEVFGLIPSAQPDEKRTKERTKTHACDLISRQAAIDALDKRFDNVPMEQTAEILKLRKDLRELPSIQPKTNCSEIPNNWIPCSERLPEKGNEVLVCYEFKGHRFVLIGTLYGDGKFYGYDDEYLTPEGRKYRKAVAWMPLPEAYRTERRTDEQ